MKAIIQKKTILHILLIVAVGLLAYSNTFNSPFQWDDKKFIVNNSLIRDLAVFLNPEAAQGHELYGALRSRYVGYLTFAFNYRINGLNVTGFHIFNFIIHILNALMVYSLASLTLKTPLLRNHTLQRQYIIPLAASMLFVSHPIQTEAVTYIFQRLASLAAFFYLASILSYAGSRLAVKRPARYGLYALSLLTAALAMKTKENAFTLPVIIILYDRLFLDKQEKDSFLRFVPLLLTLLIIPLSSLNIASVEESKGVFAPISGAQGVVSSHDYFLTQLKVIVIYIKLLFFPANQTIEYDLQTARSFFEPSVMLCAVVLLSLVAWSFYLMMRSRTRPVLRLASFGILWLFITLSVESSIIPLPMLIDEYRMYLPSVGVFMAAGVAASYFFTIADRRGAKAAVTLILIALPLALGVTTYKRNSVWSSEIRLWEDVVSKAPMSARGHFGLAAAYGQADMRDKAIEHYEETLRLDPTLAVAHTNVGVIYGAMGSIDKAMAHYQAALKLDPYDVEARNNLGTAYAMTGRVDRAIEIFQSIIQRQPSYARAYGNLGVAYYSQGLIDRAIENYRLAVRIEPDFVDAHYNLGLALLKKGLIDEARSEFRMTLYLMPTHFDARRLLGQITSADSLR